MPILFYWFRCTIRFWNSLLSSNNPLHEKIVRADLLFANRSDTWTYQVLYALQDLPTFQQLLDAIRSRQTINLEQFKLTLREHIIGGWRDLDILTPHAHHSSRIKKIEPLCSLQWLSQFLSGLATCVGMHGYQETSLAVSSSRGPREGCLRQRALRVTHLPSWSSLTCCRRAVVSTFWGPPSGPPPPSLPLLSSLGHLGVQQQL